MGTQHCILIHDWIPRIHPVTSHKVPDCSRRRMGLRGNGISNIRSWHLTSHTSGVGLMLHRRSAGRALRRCTPPRRMAACR
jgi:hypothetical protein